MTTLDRKAVTPDKRFYRPELDALRFFAFLWVFAFIAWITRPSIP